MIFDQVFRQAKPLRNTIMTKTKISALALLCVAAVPAAFAASWQPYGEQSAEAPRSIYAQEDDGVATLLSCNADGQLSAMVSYKGGELTRKMKANAPFRRTVDVNIVRDGTDEGKSPWTIIPAVDLIHTKSHGDAGKIYNAAILGQDLTVKIQRKGEVALTLPAVDDVFRAFATTCQPPAGE